MDAMRIEEKASFTEASAEMEKGLVGIQKALKVLNDYYGKVTGDHGGGAIIGMLETAESDITKGIAEGVAAEKAAQTDYDATTQENKMAKASKDKDVEYKTKEFTGLDKSLTELKSDRTSEQTELDAVLEYEAKINEKCIAKVPTYEEIKAKREAEIAGLKEALDVLAGEAVLLQEGHSRRLLRATKQH